MSKIKNYIAAVRICDVCHGLESVEYLLAAKQGRRVVVIEKETLGGACYHRSYFAIRILRACADKLQNAWIEIIQREGVHTLAMMVEINGCPHEEGLDYPLGEVCPACPFWSNRRRPLEPPAPATVLTAIATYRQDQWETLLAAAADRDTMDETWEKWNAGIEKLIAGLEARSIPYVRVVLIIRDRSPEGRIGDEFLDWNYILCWRRRWALPQRALPCIKSRNTRSPSRLFCLHCGTVILKQIVRLPTFCCAIDQIFSVRFFRDIKS